ncbi:MAG: PACE efflux transporter [Desulfobacterales bacterium]|nr:PACE efflux transporter [Desulfobacterales bacterium]
MEKKPQMRSGLDRIRHALLFEGILLTLTVVILTGLFNKSATHMGALGILTSLVAMAWNYVYNLLFDHTLIRMGRPLYPRGIKMRSLHAIVFELGLMFFTVPLVMVIMKFTFIQALLMDVGLVAGILVYTLAFNYAYDWIFPIPQEAA